MHITYVNKWGKICAAREADTVATIYVFTDRKQDKHLKETVNWTLLDVYPTRKLAYLLLAYLLLKKHAVLKGWDK